jgi:hypothetical protein
MPRPQQQAGGDGSDVPHVAAILPDAVFGCLPLHYAVANGANVNVNYVLLQAYPLSKHVAELFLVHQMVLLVLIKGSMVAVQRCEHWPISCSQLALCFLNTLPLR